MLKGWPLYYAQVVDLSNELLKAVSECKNCCTGDDKLKILASSVSLVGSDLLIFSEEIRRHVKNEAKKS